MIDIKCGECGSSMQKTESKPGFQKFICQCGETLQFKSQNKVTTSK